METEKSSERPNLGYSLPVRNVQELAAKPEEVTSEILARYIRPEMSGECVVSGDNPEVIPVIDMSKLMDKNFMEEEAAKLKLACEDWGFFQVVNHGVPENVIEEMKADIKKFFELPLEERETIAQIQGDIEGYGNANVLSDEQKLDWADMIYIFTQPPEVRKFKHWPTQPSSFRESLENYSIELQKVAYRIFTFVAINLGVDPEKIIKPYNSQLIRINYYPPCPDAHDKVVGLPPHSDGSGITLLLQSSVVAGLQIRRNGSWLPVYPLPDALVVNVGDSLEILTNGKYKSIEHRAVINAHNERMSIAAFHTNSFGTMVGPLADIVGDGEPLFKTLSFEDYLKVFFSKELDGKSFVERMKLNA